MAGGALTISSLSPLVLAWYTRRQKKMDRVVRPAIRSSIGADGATAWFSFYGWCVDYGIVGYSQGAMVVAQFIQWCYLAMPLP